MKNKIDSRVLVTGGAGFIGSHLVEALLKEDRSVVVLDDLSTGHKENLKDVWGHPRLTFIEGDILDFSLCRQAVADCDYVLHEAALGSVQRSIEAPQRTLEINIRGFINIIEAARQEKIKRFIYASSSSVYGNDQHIPKQEDSIGCPLSPYACSKQSNEQIAALYAGLYGMETIGLRYFNVFGPRQNPNGCYAAVIPKFVMTLMKHESPVINGDGSYSRDFTYVDNVVQANLLALTVENQAAIGQVYNIAGGERTTLSELFACLREELSALDPEIAKIESRHAPNRAGDIPHSFASIDKAKRLLGYTCPFNLTAGIKELKNAYFHNYQKST